MTKTNTIFEPLKKPNNSTILKLRVHNHIMLRMEAI